MYRLGKLPKQAASSTQEARLALNHSRARAARARASGTVSQDGVPLVSLERSAHPAGDYPGGMDPLATQPLDYLLAELAQGNAVPGQLGRSFSDPTMLRVTGSMVEAEEQVRRATGERN